MVFKPTDTLEYQPGSLFLGLDETTGKEIGVRTDRHAITIAGSGAGKGSCVFIPTLKRWSHNCVVIDPKGENLRETWADREAKGQAVHVIDPFNKMPKSVPDRLRASFNPLQQLDKDSLTAGADLTVIADGLIAKTNPDHAQWDETAMKILAGVMGFTAADAPPEHRTLNAARKILLQEADDLAADARLMLQSEEFDGLVESAGSIILDGLASEKSLEAQALSQAKRQTQWLSMRGFRNVLSDSTFSLDDLKHGKCSLYLILPPEYLDTQGAFLKLFVRSSINAMIKGHVDGNKTECLFLLDEFYSMGKLDAILKGFGILRGFGVHLWPFLQDLGQLIELYGTNGAETFFSNSDAHQFFGTTDPMTLQHISVRLGVISSAEMPDAPSAPIMLGGGMGNTVSSLASQSNMSSMRTTGGVLGGAMSGMSALISSAAQASYQNEVAEYQKQMSRLGQPRIPPDEVGAMIQRGPDFLAKSMIVFVAGHGPIKIAPAPYFRSHEESVPALRERRQKELEKAEFWSEAKKVEIRISNLLWKIVYWMNVMTVSLMVAMAFIFFIAHPIGIPENISGNFFLLTFPTMYFIHRWWQKRKKAKVEK